MPRPKMTVPDRIKNVEAAASALAPLLIQAERMTARYGAADPRAIRTWEAVEVHGATIHRQSRLLAGKAKGG